MLAGKPCAYALGSCLASKNMKPTPLTPLIRGESEGQRVRLDGFMKPPVPFNIGWGNPAPTHLAAALPQKI